MTGLTRDQQDCLDAVRSLTVDGVPPSLEELRVHLGLASKSGVQRLLVQLRERGRVTWLEGRARSLAIIETEVSPAVLNGMSDEVLRITAAIIARILAQRTGGGLTAEVFHRIADRLPGVRGKAA